MKRTLYKSGSIDAIDAIDAKWRASCFRLLNEAVDSSRSISHDVQTLKRVSEPSASIKVTVRLLIQISRAKRIGFNRATSLMGAVL